MHSDALPVATSLVDFDPNGGLNALTSRLITGAATGDLPSQRELRDALGEAMVRHADTQPSYEITASCAMLLARLCAAHRQAADANYLGAILFNAAVGLGERGKGQIGANYAFEALSIYEQLAARGDDDAAVSVASILGAFPNEEIRAELVARAKLLISRNGEREDP